MTYAVIANAIQFSAEGQPSLELVENEWLYNREGKFTASRIAELCTKDRSGKEMGKTAISYVYQVLAEQMGDIEDHFETKEMEHGKMYESMGVEFFAKQFPKYKNMLYLAQVFFPHKNKALKDWAGASPDFMVGKTIVGEIKVPYTTKKYMEYLALDTGADLLRYNKDYYYQVQMQIACTGAKKAVFVVFNPKWLTSQPNKCLKVIEIEKDTAVIAEIETAIVKGKEMIVALKAKYRLR